MAAGSEEAHTSAEQWLPQGPVAASEGLDCLSLPPGQDDQTGPVLSPGLPTLRPSPCRPPHLGAACEGGGGSRLTARGPPRWGAMTRVPGHRPPSLPQVAGASAPPQGSLAPGPAFTSSPCPSPDAAWAPVQSRQTGPARVWKRAVAPWRWKGRLLREPRRVTAPHAGPAVTQQLRGPGAVAPRLNKEDLGTGGASLARGARRRDRRLRLRNQRHAVRDPRSADPLAEEPRP